MFCRKTGLPHGQKVTAKGQDISVCPDDIFYIDKHFVNKLGIEMQYHEPECHAKRLVCYFPGQAKVHVTKIRVSTIFSELMILLLPNLV